MSYGFTPYSSVIFLTYLPTEAPFFFDLARIKVTSHLPVVSDLGQVPLHDLIRDHTPARLHVR